MKHLFSFRCASGNDVSIPFSHVDFINRNGANVRVGTQGGDVFTAEETYTKLSARFDDEYTAYLVEMTEHSAQVGAKIAKEMTEEIEQS